jgi:hypothetical protein
MIVSAMMRKMDEKSFYIPSKEGCQNTKGTASSQKRDVSSTSAAVLQVGKAEHQEGQVESKEEQEERDRRA